MRVLLLAAGINGNLLLSVAREIPARGVSLVRKYRADARLVDGLLGGVFGVSVFERDDVAAVYCDSANWIGAEAKGRVVYRVCDCGQEYYADEDALHEKYIIA